MANAGYLPGPERRRRILDGAKKIFAARGYHDTNISHICDDLGIARGTLYQYFTSKRDVFAAVIDAVLERLREVVAREGAIELPSVPPTREQIIQYTARRLQTKLEAVFEDEASLRILVREAVGLDLQMDAVLRAIDEIMISRVAGDLEIAQRNGYVRADVNLRQAALFVIGGVQKVALDALGRDGKVDVAELALSATRMNLTGLLSEEVHS